MSACQRQVELSGPDAKRLLQKMTPRDISGARAGDCLYVPLIDEDAGMLNDPVVLKLAENHYWLSISDSDILLWARGLALGFGMDVDVCEPDVSPLAVQGPLAEETLVKIFGERLRDIPYFGFDRLLFGDRNLVIARSGYSKQGGFEIYLDDSELGFHALGCSVGGGAGI